MKEFDDIDKLFASGFEDFQVNPPERVKLNLDQELFSGQTPEKTKKSWRKRWFLFLIPVALMAAYIVVSEMNDSTSNPVQTSSSATSSTHSIQQKTSRNNTAKNEVKNPSKVTSKSTFSVSQNKKKQGKVSSTVSNQNAKKSPKKNDSHLKSYVSHRKVKQVNSSEKPSGSVVHSGKKAKQKTVSKSNHPIAINQALLIDESSINISTKEDSRNELKAVNTTESKEIASKERDIVKVDSLKNTVSKDSLQTIKTTDSLKNLATKEKSSKEPNHKWQIAIYGGLLRGFSNVSDEAFHLNEIVGLDVSLETSYQLTKKWSISSGLSYNTRNQEWTKTSHVPDTVVDYNFVITYDSLGVADTLYVPIYSIQDSTVLANRTYTYQTFSLPISVNFTLFEQNNWSGSIGAGLRFSYHKIISNQELGTMESPTITSFGMQWNVRPEVNYSLSKISLGAYARFAGDLKEPFQWSFKQQHFSFGMGLLMKYRF